MRPAITRRLAFLGVTVAAMLAALTLGVVPFRDWLEQRERTTELRVEVAEVEAVNQSYEERIDALNTDEEIEERARREYNLVLPDEEAYAVLPPPALARQLPGVWPFNR